MSEAFVDSLVSTSARTGAAVLVAQDGKVFIDKSYGIGPQPKYMPTTTVPQFALGAIANVFTGLCAQVPLPRERCLATVLNGIGMHKTGQLAVVGTMSSVDELYRWAQMLPVARVITNPTATPEEFSRTFDANRDRQATIIVLTNDDSADAAGIADRMMTAFDNT